MVAGLRVLKWNQCIRLTCRDGYLFCKKGRLQLNYIVGRHQKVQNDNSDLSGPEVYLRQSVVERQTVLFFQACICR